MPGYLFTCLLPEYYPILSRYGIITEDGTDLTDTNSED